VVSTVQKNPLLSYFDGKTLGKGRDYFESGKVKSCAEGRKGCIVGLVKGTREYAVTVRLEAGAISSTSCSCPLQSNCKHTAALVYRFLDREFGTLAGRENSDFSGAGPAPGPGSGPGPGPGLGPGPASGTGPAPAQVRENDELAAAPPRALSKVDGSGNKSRSDITTREMELPEFVDLVAQRRQQLRQEAARQYADMSQDLRGSIASLINAAKSFEMAAKSPPAEPSERVSRNILLYSLSDPQRGGVPKINIEKRPVSRDGSWKQAQPVALDKLLDSKSRPAYISEQDVEIARLWRTLAGESFYSYYGSTVKFDTEAELLLILLKRILATGRCYAQGNYSAPLSLGPVLKGEISWEPISDDKQRLSVIALDGARRLSCFRWKLPWYYDPESNTCGPVELDSDLRLNECIANFSDISDEDAENVQRVIAEMQLQGIIPAPKTKRNIIFRMLPPEPHLRIETLYSPRFPDASGIVSGADAASVRVLVVDNHFGWESSAILVENDTFVKETCDLIAASNNCQRIAELGFEMLPSRDGLPRSSRYMRRFVAADSVSWLRLLQNISNFKNEGWEISEEVFAEMSPIEVGDDQLTFNVEQEQNWWFSLALDIEVEGKKMPLLPILLSAIKALPPGGFALSRQAASGSAGVPPASSSASSQNSFIESLNSDGRFYATVADGKVLSIPFERIRPILISLHEMLLSRPDHDPALVELSGMEASSILQDATSANWLGAGANALAKLTQRLLNLASPAPAVAPPTLKAELRPYQLEGLAWLNLLAEQQFGGILADDMGLGKTIQLLAHICAAKSNGKLEGRPFLVLSPTSVLPNWLSECARFAPHLKVLALNGANRAERFDQIADADLVLTTYPLLHRDLDVLKEIAWRGIALDEAQWIKNAKTKMAKSAYLLKADYRFCLSGTPVENHLGELWSQFQFLQPGFLGDSYSFKNTFREEIEKNNNQLMRSILAQRIRPFILRRTKEEVATDLPAKTVITKTFELEGAQRDLYETVRLASTKKIHDEIAGKGFRKSQIIILDALLKLRQVCCDPRLVKLAAARKVTESAKLELLMSMLSELHAEGRKVLLFSQFTSMLDLIAAELQTLKISFVELRGDTTDRKTPVDSFQNGDASVFLLSLKAGGTGLNLTAADTVIHYDPWWNPAVEAQATDRAHRIGQDKNVFVYKLIAAGSIEERMLALQAEKESLAKSIYSDSGNAKFSFSESDLSLLLRPIDDFTA